MKTYYPYNSPDLKAALAECATALDSPNLIAAADSNNPERPAVEGEA